MQLVWALVVVTKDYAGVDPAQGVEADKHLSLTEGLCQALPDIGVAAADQDQRDCAPARRIGVPEEDHVHSLAPQDARGGAGEARAERAVQHLHLDAVVTRWNCECVAFDLVGGRPQGRNSRGRSPDAERNQRDDGVTTSEFHNRTVGSSRVQPEATWCMMRRRATSRSTPLGSRG